MSSLLSTLSIVIPTVTAVVVVALFVVMWCEHTSTREGRIALACGGVLAVWAVTATIFASRGVFQSASGETVPPMGVNLVIALLVPAFCLGVSPFLRSLLSRQSSLIRLHPWRILGVTSLLPLAMQLHVISLSQLRGGT